MKLVLVQVIDQLEFGRSLPNILLLKANVWLQRRLQGVDDDLLVVGTGFEDEDSFGTVLRALGVEGAHHCAIPAPGQDQLESLSQCIGDTVQSWLAKNHPAAVPVCDWRGLISNAAYPTDGWWWVGVEGVLGDAVELRGLFETLAPASLRPQAATWAAIAEAALQCEFVGHKRHDHEATMTALALVQWLCGFDAAADNSFYHFDQDQAVREAAGLDLVRLGLEAAAHEDTLDLGEEELSGQCLLIGLRERAGQVAALLSDAFGGRGCLFWSLHSSIWPVADKPHEDAMEALLGLQSLSYRELQRAWAFVEHGPVEPYTDAAVSGSLRPGSREAQQWPAAEIEQASKEQGVATAPPIEISSLRASIVERVAHLLSEMGGDSLLSGEESGLKTVWDEVCVQVQGEQSFFWATYLEVIDDLLGSVVARLPESERRALWLKSERGQDWEDDMENGATVCGTPPIVVEDIVGYLQDYVLQRAADHESPAIRRYLSGQDGDGDGDSEWDEDTDTAAETDADEDEDDDADQDQEADESDRERREGSLDKAKRRHE